MGAPGFDDAPIVEVLPSHEKQLQLIYPYYENPDFLRRQIVNWCAYPAPLRNRLRAIIVDDGSPNNAALDVLRSAPVLPFPIRLFRIDIDVRWNWLAARNIGAHHAASGWCLFTDMDHMLHEEAAAELVCGGHDENIIYRLSRKEHTGAAIHPHPNTMMLTRSMFWKAGGYDEALSGHYGTDGDWRRRLAATAKVKTLGTQISRYEYVGDSSTTHYKRKQPEDAGKKAIIARRGRGWKPKVLSFPYHEESL